MCLKRQVTGTDEERIQRSWIPTDEADDVKSGWTQHTHMCFAQLPAEAGGTLEGWPKETWHQVQPSLCQTVTGVNSKTSESDTNWIFNVLPIAQGHLRMIRHSAKSKCTVQTFPHHYGVKPFLKVKSTNSAHTQYKNETHIHRYLTQIFEESLQISPVLLGHAGIVDHSVWFVDTKLKKNVSVPHGSKLHIWTTILLAALYSPSCSRRTVPAKAYL